MVDDADEAELLQRLPRARVERVAEAGHSVQGDQPLLLAELLAAFGADGGAARIPQTGQSFMAVLESTLEPLVVRAAAPCSLSGCRDLTELEHFGPGKSHSRRSAVCRSRRCLPSRCNERNQAQRSSV